MTGKQLMLELEKLPEDELECEVFFNTQGEVGTTFSLHHLCRDTKREMLVILLS